MRSIVILHYFLPVISTGVFFAVTQLLGVLLGNRSSTLRENNRIVTTTIPPGPSLSGYDGQFCASGKLMKSFANSKYSTVIEKTEGLGGRPVPGFNSVLSTSSSFKHFHLKKHSAFILLVSYLYCTIAQISRIHSDGLSLSRDLGEAGDLCFVVGNSRSV